jgi:hypothetical protein
MSMPPIRLSELDRLARGRALGEHVDVARRLVRVVEERRDRDRVVRGETTRAVELQAVVAVDVDELDVDRTGQELT